MTHLYILYIIKRALQVLYFCSVAFICVYFYSCVFGKRNYRVLVRVSVCVCVCVCVCVFLHDNSKRNRSRNTKSEYIVVYENSSDEFDIELHRIKVKVTVGVQKSSPFTTIQTVRSYSSTLVQARNLILRNSHPPGTLILPGTPIPLEHPFPHGMSTHPPSYFLIYTLGI